MRASSVRRLFGQPEEPVVAEGRPLPVPGVVPIPPNQPADAKLFREHILLGQRVSIGIDRFQDPKLDFLLRPERPEAPGIGPILASEGFTKFLEAVGPDVTPAAESHLTVRTFTDPKFGTPNAWNDEVLFRQVTRVGGRPFISFACLYYALLPQVDNEPGPLPYSTPLRFYVDLGGPLFRVEAYKFERTRGWSLHATSIHARTALLRHETVVSW